MRKVAVAKASLMAVKAVVAASVQASSLELLVVEERRALSGWSMSAHFGMKRW